MPESKASLPYGQSKIMKLTSITRRLHAIAEKIDDWAALQSNRIHAADFLEAYRARDRRLGKGEQPYRLHVGCGSVRLPFWINTDYYPSKSADFAWDARYPYPLPDASCQFIYNEHFLEHLPLDVAVRFLADCHRMLVPGGVLRIAMPSLTWIVEYYRAKNWYDQDWLQAPEYKSIRTPCEMLNVSLRSWGHQWIYDQEELTRRLFQAGFCIVRNKERIYESRHTELRNLETRPDSLLVCEAVKEEKE